MEAQTETAPLGIIDCLSAGFGAVAQRPSLLLIPLLLDLFLWLGPRLSIAPLAPELVTRLRTVAEGRVGNSADLFQQNTIEILGSFNLFSALSTWPLGAPSLLAGNDPGSSPFKSPPTIQLQGFDELLAWLLALTLGGLLLGSLYLSRIALWADKSHVGIRAWIKLVWLHWARIVALVFTVLLGAFILSMSFFLALEAVSLVFTPLAAPLLLLGVGTGMWALFHLFFAVHGILVDGLTIPQAISNSVALVRQHPFSSVRLLVMAVVIDLGLSTIWNMPPSESWLRLIAIAGNAFINTGLATATFIYYCGRARSVRSIPQ
jgi:hypothetical protein